MEKKIEKAILRVIVVAFTLCFLATLAIPVVLAIKYCWQWLLFYPALLVLFYAFCRKRSKKK